LLGYFYISNKTYQEMFDILFKNKIKYIIEENSCTVYLRLLGEVSSGNIIKANKQIFDDKKFKKGFNWIVDCRKGRQMFSPNQMDVFLNFIVQNSELFQNTKMAFVLDSPIQSLSVDALVNLYRNNNIRVDIKKIANTKAAFDWVCSN
jgi:hypothetical protein